MLVLRRSNSDDVDETASAVTHSHCDVADRKTMNRLSEVRLDAAKCGPPGRGFREVRRWTDDRPGALECERHGIRVPEAPIPMHTGPVRPPRVSPLTWEGSREARLTSQVMLPWLPSPGGGDHPIGVVKSYELSPWGIFDVAVGLHPLARTSETSA